MHVAYRNMEPPCMTAWPEAIRDITGAEAVEISTVTR